MTGMPFRGRPAADDPAEGGRVGVARAAGFVIAGTLAMLGIVSAVNLTRYGTGGALLGVALLALGATGTVILFRVPRP